MFLDRRFLRRSASFWRIVLPPGLTIVLFLVTIFVLILPFINRTMMTHKRTMIREMVSTAWSDIAYFESLEISGQLTRAEAQHQAIEHIRALRFGADNADYFWINDQTPVMILHPYRPDLEGQNISTYADPSGKFLFQEMVDLIQAQESGYVDYQWQWQDDPSHVVPKISFVKSFQPWGWIIGTGIYIEDVKAEIAEITGKLVWACIGIVIAIMALGSVVVLQGVAAQKRWRHAEDEARQRLVELSHLSRLQTMKVMTTQIVHEIDQPLGTILLRTSLVTDEIQEGQPVTRELIDNLEEVSLQVERASRIVKRIRNFSKGQPIAKERTDLNVLITNVLEFVEAEIRHNAVSLNFFPGHTETTPAESLWVFADATLIEQVVMNIVRNAIEALRECPKESRRLTVKTRMSGEQAHVVVQDSGPGLAADRIEDIFESLYTTKNEGLGIGLSISRSIVEEHGGRLWADPDSDQGSIFQFTLPLVM